MRSNGNGRVEAGAQALGGTIRARRKELGLDQLELCDLAGVGPAFVYALEKGKPTVRLDKVLAVLHVLGLELHLRPGRESVSADERLGAPKS